MEKIIQLKNITMMFGRVKALENVNLHVNQGEVLGLLGDNGAGKSTLIKVLAGLHTPTSGEIYVRGRLVSHWNTKRSREAKIETVFQDRALTVQQSIAANIFMGRELANAFGFVNLSRQRREAQRLMDEIGFTSKIIRPDSVVGHLSGGERQGVAIARAIYNDADLVVLDEPTTALSLTETNKVFGFVEKLRAAGKSVLFIGHNIQHVYDIAERFVVMDRGTNVLNITKDKVSSALSLARYMSDLAHGLRPEIGELL
jgi:simple sugar transport system ATP-binding protein